MKLIDRNGRLFGKISVVDVLVILVVAVMALALYVKGHQTQTSTSTVNSTITYQVQVRGIRTYLAQAVKEGTISTTRTAAAAALWGRTSLLRRSRAATWPPWTAAPWRWCPWRTASICCSP